MRLIAIVALVSATSLPAQSQSAAAQDIAEGNGLYAAYASPSDYAGLIACHAYILGVADATDGMIFCSPQGTRRQQAVDLVTAGLSAHPEERQKPSVGLVWNYLREAWPCPQTLTKCQYEQRA